MRVRDLLRNKGSSVITTGPGTPLGTAIRLLMEHSIGGLPVVAPDGSPVGFIAEREIVGAVDQSGEAIRSLSVARVMRRPAPTCTVEDTLEDVMARMTRGRFRHLVVLDGERIAGVISIGDLVKHRLEQLETEAGVLRDYVAAQRASR